jgi:isopenicillin-N epimerase
VVSWGACAEATGEAVHDGYTGASVLERRLQWQGTRDLSAFLAVPAAIDFQERHGWEEVRRRCHALAAETRERLGALTGLAPICRDQDFGQMAAIALPRCDPEAVRQALFERHRIEVPLTTHTDRQFVRVAFQGYNTRGDADALVAALREIFGLRGVDRR